VRIVIHDVIGGPARRGRLLPARAKAIVVGKHGGMIRRGAVPRSGRGARMVRWCDPWIVRLLGTLPADSICSVVSRVTRGVSSLLR
jgi:hypothetical protein